MVKIHCGSLFTFLTSWQHFRVEHTPAWMNESVIFVLSSFQEEELTLTLSQFSGKNTEKMQIIKVPLNMQTRRTRWWDSLETDSNREVEAQLLMCRLLMLRDQTCCVTAKFYVRLWSAQILLVSGPVSRQNYSLTHHSSHSASRSLQSMITFTALTMELI